MPSWIKYLFGSFDRQQLAADRAAKALEDVADMLESARDQFCARLGSADADPVALPSPLHALTVPPADELLGGQPGARAPSAPSYFPVTR